MEVLLRNGALDVYFTPIYMKKNRPATKVSVICEKSNLEIIKNIIFKHTTTLGFRIFEVKRKVLPRKFELINTKFGNITKKISVSNDDRKEKYEYDELREIALKNDISLLKLTKILKEFS